MFSRRMTPLLACALGAAILTLSAVDQSQAREVYRWIDGEGIVHLSDTPPLSERAESIIVPVVRPTAPAPRVARAAPEPVPQPVATPAPLNHVVQQVVAPITPPLAVRRDGWFFSVLPAVPAPRPSDPGLAQAQRQALEQRGLIGPRRPVSINSSIHAQRVDRSQSLPLGEP